MHPVRLLLSTAVMLLALESQAARAEWRDWVPFANKGSATATKKKTTSRTPLLGGKPIRSTGADKPSMMARMGNGTRKFLGRTKDALSFGDDGDDEPSGRHTSWDDEAAPYRIREKKEDKSSWFSWFRRDEPRPSATVQDFLSQERPEQAR